MARARIEGSVREAIDQRTSTTPTSDRRALTGAAPAICLGLALSLASFAPLEAAPSDAPLIFGHDQAPTSQSCLAPDQRCTWELTDGGPYEEKALGAAALANGGFIVVGDARGAGSPNFSAWAMSVSADGRRLWRIPIGGAEGDQLVSVTPTSGGGALAVGHTRSKGRGESDVWIVRLAPSGLVLWEKTFGGPENDRAKSVVRLADGGYAVAGFTASFGAGSRDMWLLRLDDAGAHLWSRTFGGVGTDSAMSVAATADGGIALTGQIWAEDAPRADLAVMRLNAEGDVLWRRTVDRSKIDIGTAVAPTADGGLMVLGSSQAETGLTDDVLALRYDAAGDLVWEKRLGAEKRDVPWSTTETANGDILIAAATWSFGAGSADAWLLRLSASGDEVWRRTYGGPAWDRALGVLALPGDEMLMIGHTSNKGAGYEDAWMLRLDSDGRL
ncbi:MAG: hypothetical protein AAFQ73_09365 [Pseudomonadota bacterium]